MAPSLDIGVPQTSPAVGRGKGLRRPPAGVMTEDRKVLAPAHSIRHLAPMRLRRLVRGFQPTPRVRALIWGCMRFSFRHSFLLLGLFAQGAFAQSGDLAIVGAHIETGDGKVLSTGTILIRGGKIAEVGESVVVCVRRGDCRW